MGNRQSRSSKLPTFKKDNWHMVPSSRLARPEYGLYYLYRNNLTNELVEEYQIYFHNSADYQKYLEFFEWRQREDSIVNTKFINSEEVKEFCNTNHNAKIYIEHIPVRLSHIEDIPYPENLYVLFSALDGFEKIFFWVGYFQPTEDMICVDGDGKVKAWLNPDLSKCHHPESQFTDETSQYRSVPQYQEQMVAEIIALVEQNTSDQIQAGMTFTQHLWHSRKGKKLNFKEAKQEIIQYAKKNHTQIPNYFESVMTIFEQERQSEHEADEPSVRGRMEQRAKEEEKRIFRENRQTAPQERERINSQQWTNHDTDHLVQESVIKGSLKPEGRPSTSEQHKQDQERLPYFSMLPPQTRTQFRSTSPSMTKQGNNQTNGAFQVKFNYQHNQPYSPQVIHSLPQPQSTQPLRPPPANFGPPQSAPIPQSPIQLLPSNPPRIPSEVVLEPPKPKDQDLIFEGAQTKLVYSDTTDTYELDEQITKDIMKYFGPQHA